VRAYSPITEKRAKQENAFSFTVRLWSKLANNLSLIFVKLTTKKFNRYQLYAKYIRIQRIIFYKHVTKIGQRSGNGDNNRPATFHSWRYIRKLNVTKSPSQVTRSMEGGADLRFLSP